MKVTIDRLQTTIEEKTHENTKLKAEKDNCEINLTDALADAIDLEQKVADVENNNKQLTADKGLCENNLEFSKEETTTCNVLVSDLNSKVKDVNDQLTTSKNKNYEDSLLIISLKSASDELTKSLSSCKADNTQLNESLNIKTADYNREELEMQGEIARLKASQALLEQCEETNDKLELSYEAAKADVAELTDKFGNLQTKYDETTRKLEEQIQVSISDLGQCKTSLKSETDKNTACEIQVGDLETTISDVQAKLNASQQVKYFHHRQCV